MPRRLQVLPRAGSGVASGQQRCRPDQREQRDGNGKLSVHDVSFPRASVELADDLDCVWSSTGHSSANIVLDSTLWT